MELLKFNKGNSKLPNNIYTFSLPSGFSCPFANECLSKAEKETGKITDGKNTKYRCFSATQESVWKFARKQRWYNFDLLRKLDTNDMAKLISQSIPEKAKIIRIHVAGDFFSQKYFDAWLKIAKENHTIIMYAYTKSLKYWVERLDEIPSNFRLTASKGGRIDELIEAYNLKYAEVVYSKKEAREKGFEIDHDDSHAYDKSKKSFALLIHGTQPSKSEASRAWTELKKKGKSGYSRKKKKKLAKVS